jgi:peptidoglycan/xylan/chitin deacetylase (PgdA/CDA1 family)
MTLSRREVLQLAALGALGAGCAPGDDTQRAGAGRATRASTPIGPRSPAPPVPSSAASSAPSSARPSGTAPELGHGPRSGSGVALTFHGAGDPGIARAVLHELAQARVHATVLAVGTWLEGQPAMAAAVLGGGHELGNHTQHHLPMRGLDARTAHREIVECARVLRRLTGSPGRWFRASGTQHTNRIIRAAAARAGYAECLSYDVDSLDWTDPGALAISQRVLARARPGSIVSLHLGHRGTVDALPAVLSGLATKGLRALTVSELLA